MPEPPIEVSRNQLCCVQHARKEAESPNGRLSFDDDDHHHHDHPGVFTQAAWRFQALTPTSQRVHARTEHEVEKGFQGSLPGKVCAGLRESGRSASCPNDSIGPMGNVTSGKIVGSLRAGDSFGGRAVVYGGVRSATVVTGTPCALFTLCCKCTMSRELVLSCVQQSSVMSHFLPLVVRVMEMSSNAAK